MQTLTHTREVIRELVQANAFVELNRYFDSLEARWYQAPPGEFPAYLSAVESHLLIDPDQGDRALSQVLRAWIDACPRAYHPQIVMGFYCLNRACQVDDGGARTPARWLAVEQMCETAAAHLLRGFSRSERPVAAAIGLQALSGRFREPGWLIELFTDQPARFRPSARADVEVQEAAAPYLVRHGVMPLADLPRMLPDGLQPRHERQAPQAYWLSQALVARPGCFEAVRAHASYLLQERRGHVEAIERLVGMPSCQGWGEPLRNALRWMAIEARLKLPAIERPSAVADYQQLFESWALRPLRPRETAVLLAWRGALQASVLHDPDKALADFTESLACPADLGGISILGAPLRHLVKTALLSTPAHEQALLNAAILRLSDGRSHAAACALRAAGHQHGLWGMARSADQAERWLASAIKRQRAGQAPGLKILDLVRLLWSGNRHDVACDLLRGCAEHALSGAALSLFELHQGEWSNTPEHYLDTEVAEQWLHRAVRTGSRQAKYRLACLQMHTGAGLGDRDKVIKVRQLLIDALGNAQTNAGARLQLGILLRQFGEPRERGEAVAYLLSLVEHPDRAIAARASAELGLAWMQGRGTRRQSRYAAIEWVTHAATLRPGDSAIETIHAEVLNSHNRVRTLFTQCGAALFRGGLRPSELPPKPGLSRQAGAL
nr:DUF4034 domain-containing protein [uncultured Pseudomonas sp.]